VVSFVNPHDIVLFPLFQLRSPIRPSELDPPPVPPSPTQAEDLKSKPAAQFAFRQAYYSAYGPTPVIERMYTRNQQAYRDLYYRLHAEVDAPIDRVRRAVTENGSEQAMLVLSSDHGDLLGAHGGMHQKWFNLYDEAIRVPLNIVRIGNNATSAKRIVRTPTSHIDLVPTMLAAAGMDWNVISKRLASTFSEIHPLPGQDLLPLVEHGEASTSTRTVYMMTRDHVLEGHNHASGFARKVGLERWSHGPLRIATMAHVGSNFEGIVTTIPATTLELGKGHLWKLVRTFDDPETWTLPMVEQLTSDGPDGQQFRTVPIADDWELYDLDSDPTEATNLAQSASFADVLGYMKELLIRERARSVPKRNHPRPYAACKDEL
jgi:arylsulfatase A-like enzyme